jgi:hypothetical protein
MIQKFIVLLVGALMLSASAHSETIGVVMMHGKHGTPSQLQQLEATVANAGFLVERPEMCWSAARIYDRTYLECFADIDAAATRLKRHGATAIIILGMSLGGNAALGDHQFVALPDNRIRNTWSRSWRCRRADPTGIGAEKRTWFTPIAMSALRPGFSPRKIRLETLAQELRRIGEMLNGRDWVQRSKLKEITSRIETISEELERPWAESDTGVYESVAPK